MLCIDQSANVLAYLRELLGHGGYNVLTSNSLRDGMILLRATRPGLALLGPSPRGAPGAEEAFRSALPPRSSNWERNSPPWKRARPRPSFWKKSGR